MDNQHYVKFLRGTPEAWSRLTTKDPDTLYFVCEKTGTTGKLYLGEKLISSSIDDIRLETILGLSEDELKQSQLLAYNEEEKKWENKNLADLLKPILGSVQGATSESDGVAGLTPIPHAGDENKFLKGDGTWSDVILTEEQMDKIAERVVIESELSWGSF